MVTKRHAADLKVGDKLVICKQYLDWYVREFSRPSMFNLGNVVTINKFSHGVNVHGQEPRKDSVAEVSDGMIMGGIYFYMIDEWNMILENGDV